MPRLLPPPPTPCEDTFPNITFHDPPHRLPAEDLDGWLTEIHVCKGDPDFYTYTLTLENESLFAECWVPAGQVSQSTKRDLRAGYRVKIPTNDESRCICTVNELVGQDEKRRAYVRKIVVGFGKDRYAGHLYIPLSIEEAEGYERIINSKVTKSIERAPAYTPPRRTVEFCGKIKAGGKVTTEVWSEDGEQYWRGGTTVLKVEVKGGRKHLTLKAPVDRGVYAYLVGDVGDTDWARCGRFQEVDSPDQKASKAFWVPSWREEV